MVPLNREQNEALKALNIEVLNEMQQAALSVCADGYDMVLLSPTGTGKTLAYLLPLMETLQIAECGVQALVLVPSRELALQIAMVWKSMNTPWRAMSCYGGRAAMEEHRNMREMKPSLLVGTPGRVNDHLNKNNIEAGTIRLLVIDEFDKCLELGFRDEMEQIIGKLIGLQHRYLLSATDIEEIPAFTGMEKMKKLCFLTSETPQERLLQYWVHSSEKDKLGTLYRLLCRLDGQQALVFCNHRESVERVGEYLSQQHMAHEIYHGGMEQEKRERALYKFRNGSCNVLISTDLASRGLDVPDVKNIIHYHRPLNEEAFIHRNGRTARWNAEGASFLILHDGEALPDYLKTNPEEFLLPERPKRPVPPEWVTLYIGKGKKDKVNKIDIAGFLYKKGGIEEKDLGRIDVLPRYAYVAVRRNRVRQLLCLVQNEKLKGQKTLIEEIRS